MANQKEERKTIYGVFGDVCTMDDSFYSKWRRTSRIELEEAGEEVPNIGETDETFPFPYILRRNVRVYDVYQDGTFRFFDPATNVAIKEPEEFVKDHKEIETYIEENDRLGWGGITGQNCASRDLYEKAFLTLCRLGFGPQNNAESFWNVPGHEKTLRNTVRNFCVEYFGEDEPWIDVYEYDRRNGVEGVIYD